MSTIIQYVPMKMDSFSISFKASTTTPLINKNISENPLSIFGRILISSVIFMHAAFANLFVTITNKKLSRYTYSVLA